MDVGAARRAWLGLIVLRGSSFQVGRGRPHGSDISPAWQAQTATGVRAQLDALSLTDAPLPLGEGVAAAGAHFHLAPSCVARAGCGFSLALREKAGARENAANCTCAFIAANGRLGETPRARPLGSEGYSRELPDLKISRAASLTFSMQCASYTARLKSYAAHS